MREKNFRVDLSSPIYPVLVLVVLVIVVLIIPSLNLPVADYTSVPELTYSIYKLLGFIMVFDIIFFGVIVGYHIGIRPIKVLEEEKETSD